MRLRALKSSAKKALIPALALIVLASAAVFAFPEQARGVAVKGYMYVRNIPQAVIAVFPNELPRYELVIDPEKLEEMEAALPDRGAGERALLKEHKVWKSAKLRYEGRIYDVKVRFRGLLVNHWGWQKRSWRVKLKDDARIDGRKEFDLIVANDRGYAVEQFNRYRARKLGLTSPESGFAWFEVNGKSHGVYFKIDLWEKDFLETQELSADTAFYGEDGHGGEMYAPFGESDKLWERKVDGTSSDESLERLLAIVNADDETFHARIWDVLDRDLFITWLVHAKLSGSTHQSRSGNIRLYLDPVTGKFRYFPVDVHMYPPDTRSLFVHYHPIVSRLVEDAAFMDDYESRLWAYVSQEGNLEDDLREYDRIVDEIRFPLYQDTLDNLTITQVKDELSKFRTLLISNFRSVKEVLERDAGAKYASPSGPFDGSPILPVASVREKAIPLTASEPMRLSGNLHLRESLIIPERSGLIIDPGTHITMETGIALLSRSPVIAEGTETEPIIIEGNLLVVGTGHATSSFQNVEFIGGTEGVVDMLPYSGTLALHESDARIEDCVFRDAGGDDALNAKRSTVLVLDSEFIGNSSDAIDFDWSYGIIRNSLFTDNGNDAIDLGGSSPLVIGNTVIGSGDKCISIGEGSGAVRIADNVLRDCRIGIETKEGSHVTIEGGRIEGAQIGVRSYIKKPAFGRATTRIFDTVFEGNGEDVKADSGTEISL